MTLREYSGWHQRTLVGASLTVSTLSGQYEAARLINIGNNRWAFKPEIGLSRRWGRWVLDAYAAVWLFTPQRQLLRQRPPAPIPPTARPRTPWEPPSCTSATTSNPASGSPLDGNYWYGGETSLNGVPTPTTLQSNSRIGATAALPISRHQSLKFSYSAGTYTQFGGDYQTVSAAWQYSWLGRPN